MPTKENKLNNDRFREECGAFAIYNHPESAIITYLGLYALQHRGQESAGIVASDRQQLYQHKAMGEVREVFTEGVLAELKGSIAIGHVRYSTTGTSNLNNAQPIKADSLQGSMAVAHNGNLVNALELREELERQGAIFQTTSDSEIVLHLVSHSTEKDKLSAFIYALGRLKGAYSMVACTEDTLIAARDPRGFRPLCLGKLNGAVVLASESCAFDIVGAKFVRDIEPGEVAVVRRNRLESLKPFPPQPYSLCAFERIYFSRPDSTVDGLSIYEVRKELGRILAREAPTAADLVIPVPDSSNVAALGYAQESRIPFEFGLIRSHYIGRTFIEPMQRIRDFGAKLKYNAVRQTLAGKRVVVVDDSIVRGTTSGKIINMLRRAGAKEVHLRISSPTITNPCFYGIDTPTREELIGSSNAVPEIAKYIGADSLAYISMEGLKQAVREDVTTHCYACFSGDYPVQIPPDVGKKALEGKFRKTKMF
jgi:amidophosphoribosyltransferase